MEDIKSLTKKLIEFRNERDWTQFHKPKDLAISLCLEAAEVLEHFQWKSESEAEKYAQSHQAEIGEELADVFNWVLIMAHDFDIDILEASGRKIKINDGKYPVAKAKGHATKYTEL